MATSADKSRFNTPAVVLGAAAVLVFVLALSLFLEGGWHAARRLEVEAKVYGAELPAVRDALAGQQAVLDQDYRWIDKEQGRVGVPIERAMELVVEREGGLTAEAGQ
jgi:hypothetical protein